MSTGDYVTRGMVLFEISDLSKVWVIFDAYESDLMFLQKGQKISFTLHSLPGNNYSENIAFVSPVIDPVTRVVKVRVETENRSGMLKPGMFATGIVSSDLEEYQNNIVIPRSAVLWTGKRSIVYVKQPGTNEPVFKLREIELGPDLGETYLIINGLTEGEEIVTSGTFSVDAAAQLEGKPSMMNLPVGDDLNLEHASFNVSGTCEMCKDRIERTALDINGVVKAIWDLEKKVIDVDFDKKKTDLTSIHKAIARVGHDTELFKADDVTYNALPECCLYRK